MNSLRQIRVAILIVIIGLVLSGVTAFPLLAELNLLSKMLNALADSNPGIKPLVDWVNYVRDGLDFTYQRYPFIAYGTDWLAFAHLMIAVFFILPWRDPIRYEGVLKVGVFCSVMIFPLALICGPVRGIPLGWRLIDCSFGLLCLPPLLFALAKTRAIALRAGPRPHQQW